MKINAQFATSPENHHRRYLPRNPMACDLCILLDREALTEAELLRIRKINRFEVELV